MNATLYERVGGHAAVARLVLDFYDRVLECDDLAPYFASVDMRRLVEHQAKFVSSIMGGPTSYSDQELAEIHSHLRVDSAAFESLADIFAETVGDHLADPADAARIVEIVRQRKARIVTA